MNLSRLLAATVALALAATAVLAPADAPPAHAATAVATTRATGSRFDGVYASLAGIRRFHGYVPSSYRPGTALPLLVALHGCLESVGGFEQLTGLTHLAERRGFIVVYPDQSTLANPTRCWNWFLPTNQWRDWGEPSIIAGITDWVRGKYTVDSRRIYVTGGSAGAVMANIMAVTYPDIFAAAGVLAGCEYGCDVLRLRTPERAGELAFDQMGSHARAVPVIVFHGTADPVVPPVTAARIVGQWVRTDQLAFGTSGEQIDGVPDEVESGSVPHGRSFTHAVYRSSRGTALIETYMITDAGHAWPGGCDCRFGDPLGPDASAIQWEFFLRHPRTT